jgi:putative radical SAM enzyme (TIGR03279 family)
MRVTGVTRDGPAGRAGVESGDELLSIDGRELEDALDITFALGWLDEQEADFVFSRRGSRYAVRLPAERPEELGLEIEEPPTRTCGNACVFCFVDQLPRGLRPSLYVKDEDYRLSFSFGNYMTLTNLSDRDYERIADLRLSPLYVSVHATDDAVRRHMLGFDDAPSILESLRRLRDAGVRVHTQVVLVPGMNEGYVLERTLADLLALGSTVESVAVVPVGLTAHRSGLPAIRPVDAAGASAALDAVEGWQRRALAEGRGRVFHAADELYLLAGRALPPYEDYEDLPQLENGVGLLRLFEHELKGSAPELGKRLDEELSVVVVTGELAAGFLSDALDEALGSVVGLSLEVVSAGNTLLGPEVTVAGLLSGVDLAGALSDAPPSDLYLLPAAAFNIDGITLDGMTVEDIAAGSGRNNVVATDDIVAAIKDARPGLARHQREKRNE